MKTRLIIIGVIIVGMVALFVTSMGGSNKKVEGSLEQIMDKLYRNIPPQNLPMMLDNIEVNAENIESYIGRNDIKFKEALASESMTGSIAHSIVLLRLENAEEADDVVAKIKSSANPRKWICVEVPEDQVIVKNKGDLIILIMVADENTRDKLEKGFENL